MIISIFTLASMTPLGALIGLAVTSAADNALWKDLTITILQGLAVGTFIYVTFFEVLYFSFDELKFKHIFRFFFTKETTSIQIF